MFVFYILNRFSLVATLMYCPVNLTVKWFGQSLQYGTGLLKCWLVFLILFVGEFNLWNDVTISWTNRSNFVLWNELCYNKMNFGYSKMHLVRAPNPECRNVVYDSAKFHGPPVWCPKIIGETPIFFWRGVD